MKTLEENYKNFLNHSVDTLHKQESYPVFESISEYYENVIEDGTCFYSRYEKAKKRVSFYKYKSFRDLQNNLIYFEDNFTSNGGKVIYAETKQEAISEIMNIISQHNNLNCMLPFEDILQEIDLYKELGKQKKSIFNTFLYDISSPIYPVSFEEVVKKCSESMNLEQVLGHSVNALNVYKRHSIGKAYNKTISIVGADFAVADVGGVVFLDNSGKKTIHNAFSSVQIVVLGIDQLLSSIKELDIFSSLKSTHKYGNYFPWSQTIVNGPKKSGELDGPSQMYVIWVDNGRSKILARKGQREILNCIQCGACEALCPVSKFVRNVSEAEKEYLHSPVECVTLPIIKGFENYAHLSYACTSCGKCKEVCPANIPIPELILYNRREAVEKGIYFALDKSQIKTLKKMFLKRKSMESSYNKFILRSSGIKKEFGSQKIFPDFSQKSFHVLWKEKNRDIFK